ncbi:MAG: 4-hydroxyphenylacetate 3-hydroxylase N-terminal domain-containing protein, partial [Syntrophomonadaceae bacterium]|nr:4-hydroxyphenylacetate 3-hydroxylase N-terminal domain-containing protein [Syntrophomonadaceae bacterium]
MALKTAQEYIESAAKLTPKVYVGGKRVENLLENPVTLSVVRATAKIYELAEDPQYKEIMVGTSHLTGEPVNRNLNIARNNHDLDMRQEMALLTSQHLGT